MLSFLVDENFDYRILSGLVHRKPDLYAASAKDVGLSGAKDPTLLEWAAQRGCIILTHDVSTMTAFAYERVRSAQRMPGVFEVGQARAYRESHRRYSPHCRVQLRRRKGRQDLLLALVRVTSVG